MALYVIVLFLLLGFFFVVVWLLTSWASLSYDEIIYHLKVPLEGANPGMVVSALLKYALPAVALIVGIIVMLVKLRDRPKLRRKIMVISLCAAGFLGIVAAVWLQLETRFFSSFFGDVENSDGTSFIEEHYVNPEKVELTFPEKKRNLIYIFLESMEMTFADQEAGGAFEQNLIPGLTALGRTYENFAGNALEEASLEAGTGNASAEDGVKSSHGDRLNGAVSLPGTDWTMGAMFAQTAGIPLKIALLGEVMQENDIFFPTAMTLGDILAANGYRQVLAIGSDAAFGGRDIYFSQHGNYEIHDYFYDVERGRIDEDYFVWWGLEDEKLFEYAKEELLELAAGDQPFNYTMLTVDTHFEDGYLCRLCGDEFGEDQYANVYACADRQVTEFVEWIRQQEFYENTTIVLCGDHLTMDSDFCVDVPEDYQRKTYTVIINSALDPDLKEDQSVKGGATVEEIDQSSKGGAALDGSARVFATVDMFPTTLAALGVEIPGNRLGVGANLYSKEKTLLEMFGYDRCSEEFRHSSSFLEDLSGLTVDEELLREMGGTVSLEFEDVDGLARGYLRNISWLDVDEVEDLMVVVHDPLSMQIYQIPVDIVRAGNDADTNPSRDEQPMPSGDVARDEIDPGVDADLDTNTKTDIDTNTDSDSDIDIDRDPDLDSNLSHDEISRDAAPDEGGPDLWWGEFATEIPADHIPGLTGTVAISFGNVKDYYLIKAPDRPVYRLFRPVDGRNFFTADEIQLREMVANGWELVRVAWDGGESEQAVPVYCLRPRWKDSVYFTTDAEEFERKIRNGWLSGGIAFFSAGSSGTPVYEAISPKNDLDRIYTTDMDEILSLIVDGWKFRGIAFFGR